MGYALFGLLLAAAQPIIPDCPKCGMDDADTYYEHGLSYPANVKQVPQHRPKTRAEMLGNLQGQKGNASVVPVAQSH